MKNKQKNEILVLVILGIALFIYVMMHYVITPLKTKTEELNNQVETKEIELRTQYNVIQSYKSNADKMTNYSTIISDIAKSFYDSVSEEEILDVLNKNIKDSGITFESVNVSESNYSVKSMTENTNVSSEIFEKLKAIEQFGNASMLRQDRFNTYFNDLVISGGKIETSVSVVALNIVIEGLYNDVIKFVDGITSNDKNILCSTMSLEMAENAMLEAEENIRTRCTMTVNYLNIPGLSNLYKVYEPEELAQFTFPTDILDGSYKGIKSSLTK